MILNKHFLKQKWFINSEYNYFPQTYSLRQSEACPVSFQYHKPSIVIHRRRSQPSVVNSMRGILFEELLHKLIRLNMLWDVFFIWLIVLHRNAFHGPMIMVNRNVYIGDLTFEIRSKVVRHVTITRGSPCLHKGWTYIKEALPLKEIPNCSSADILVA